MAALWWHSEVRVVSEALAGIGELKFVVSHSLRDKGFSDVRINDLEVAGGKSGCWMSLAHLHIADRRYWEVVMCSGDTAQASKATVDEVVAMLRALRFL